MKDDFHPEAAQAQELLESATYYDRRSPGLGHDCVVEIFRAIDFVREHPEASPVIAEGRRR